MKIEYWFEMPNKMTFKQKKVLSFISKYIPKKSKILIAFAGIFRFGEIDSSKFIYNDIDPEIKANHHVDAYKLAWFYPKGYFDCIIADPPFAMLSTHRFYKFHIRGSTQITFWRETANFLLKNNGIYIELGWNSTGLRKRFAEKIALGICCIGGNHNDILILVQKKRNDILNKWL